jgi:hypothetical protein
MIFCNWRRRYLNFKACIIPSSIGCDLDVV